MSDTDVCKSIRDVQDEFYSSQRKHVFFRKSQKSECADYVNTVMPLDTMIRNTVVRVNNTSHIYIDYTLFKSYATSGNYHDILNYLVRLLEEVIQEHGGFQLHVNLSSFSMTAAERYSDAIQLFFEICCHPANNYLSRMNCVYIYNTPMVMSAILTFLKKWTNLLVSSPSDPLKNKTVYYSKEESPSRLNQLREIV